ncbi:MAG TPA: cupin domain-containing protein [Terriglobales bacterium]|nr:cupin domain-containing protein [Terriglobales bacterium]
MTRREMGKALGLAAFSTAALSGLLRAEATAMDSQNSKGGDSIGVKRLFAEAVPDIGGKEVRMVLLTVPPGGTSKPHRHTGPVFAYVLEGSIRNQVDPEPIKTYHAGDIFYEPTMHVHRALNNLSNTKAAKILVFEIGEKGKEFTVAAT